MNGTLEPRHGSRRSITGIIPAHRENPVVMVDNAARQEDLELSIALLRHWALNITLVEPDRMPLSTTVGILGEVQMQGELQPPDWAVRSGSIVALHLT
jgi:hypothetical protein